MDLITATGRRGCKALLETLEDWPAAEGLSPLIKGFE
jgi:hypothetical protein